MIAVYVLFYQDRRCASTITRSNASKSDSLRN